MGSLVLIQDIVDAIIDCLDGDDLSTLRQCSLVATNWVYRSQSKLFRTIEWWGSGRFSEWLQAMGPKRDNLLSHTLNLRLFHLLDSEGQLLKLCKFPRLQEFQNTGVLPLPNDQFLTFLHSNMGSSLRTLSFHKVPLERAALISAISTFPLLDYPGHSSTATRLSILPFRFTEIQVKVRHEALDFSAIGRLIEQSSQTLRSFSILRESECTPIFLVYFTVLISSSPSLQRNTIQDNWYLAFILSRTSGAPNLHIQLYDTMGTVPERVVVYHPFTELDEIDFRDQPAGRV